MASLPKAVDLLVAWESEGIGDEILKVSVLHAWDGWTEAALGVPDAAAAREQLMWKLSVFCDAVGRCSDTVLGAECHKWSNALVQLLQSLLTCAPSPATPPFVPSSCSARGPREAWQHREAEDAAVLQKVCHAVSNLLDRVHRCLDVRDFSTHQLPVILSGLLRFASARELLQCLVLPILAQCLVQFPATTLLSKVVLKSWAVKGMFAKNMQLSQECSRLLVLLYRVPEQWSQLLSEVTVALHHLLQLTYSPVVESPQPPLAAPQAPSGAPQPPLSLPEVPVAEPQRSSTLLWQVVALSRLLCYALYFAPKEAVMVPVEDLLSAVFHGLSIQEVKGHSTEALLLVGVLPVIHIAMWNVMAVLIHSCHGHLLPFSAGIELCFLREFSRLLSSWGSCQGLWLALGRVLQAWVALRRDGDPSFLAAALRWLIIGTRKGRDTAAVVGPPAPKKMKQAAKAADSGKGSEELYLASVHCLSSIVQAVAFSLPLKQVKILVGLPRELLAEGPSPNQTEALLHLLQCYLVSGCPALMPSLSAAVQVFSQYRTHPNHKVHDKCVAALAICSLQQYPTAPCLAQPFTPEHPPVSGAHVQELHFQWTGNGVQSSEKLERPMVRPVMELSPVVVEEDRTHLQEQSHPQECEQDCQEAEPHPQECEQDHQETEPQVGMAGGLSLKDIDSDSSSDYELLRQFRDSSPDTWPEEEVV